MSPEKLTMGWHEKGITPLQNPIGEFNARGGMDLVDYLTFQSHLAIEHPNLGNEQWEAIQDTLPPLELSEDPVTKQRLRTQRFNWPDNEENLESQIVTILNLPFSVSIDLKHTIYQHYLLAQAIGSPLMVIENPGYGASDQLTPTQKYALKKGSFAPIADSMLGIIKKSGAKKINCVGYSMGADVAAAIAGHALRNDIKVENLFIMESPRVEKRNPAKLGIDFASDAKNLKFTWKHPIDPILRELANLEMGLPKGLSTYGRALYKGELYLDLERALVTQPDMRLIIASAGSSKISHSEANNNTFRSLKTKFPNSSMRRIIIPGESHAYGDSGSRYAQLVKLVLR